MNALQKRVNRLWSIFNTFNKKDKYWLRCSTRGNKTGTGIWGIIYKNMHSPTLKISFPFYIDYDMKDKEIFKLFQQNIPEE